MEQDRSGTQFAAVRQKRGLTIEKVSSETHIRVQRLREIERDDFSRFAHPSYARMFAMDYAKYLGIPISRIRRLLPDAGECGTEGYQYLQESACDYMRTTVRPFRRRRRLVRKLATTALLILLGLGGVKVWTTVRDVERLGLNRMAREDNAILTVPNIQQVDPTTHGNAWTPCRFERRSGRGERDPRVGSAGQPFRAGGRIHALGGCRRRPG